MFPRIIIYISRYGSVITRLFVISILFLNGIYWYIREMTYYLKKIKLFKKYKTGIVFNNLCYFADGSTSQDIPTNATKITETEIKDLKRILNTIPPVIGGVENSGG